MLQVNELTVAYGDLDVLHDIEISVSQNEVVSVLGSNGAGKTTLLRAISGLLPMRKGEIVFAGKAVSSLPAYKLPGLGMAHVPQGRGIFATLSVFDNLLIGGWNARARHRRQKSIDRIYQLFPVLQERTNQLAGTLSGGEQQMLAIGRALVQFPSLLMLDEPSLGLAPIIVDTMFEALSKISVEEGISLLLVEQNVFHATEMAARCYLLENGSVTLEGSKEEFEQNPVIKESYLGM